MLRRDDRVVDVGAGIGAFSLPASLIASHVWAVEPYYGKLLRRNVLENQVRNVDVLEGTLDYLGVLGLTDYLKVNCDGCEWSLNPFDFEGIRIVTGRMHNWKEHKEDWARWVVWFKDNGYALVLSEGNSYEFNFTACKVE